MTIKQLKKKKYLFTNGEKGILYYINRLIFINALHAFNFADLNKLFCYTFMKITFNEEKKIKAHTDILR